MKLTHFANECFFCSNHILYFEIENKTKSCTVILNVVKLFVIKNADTIFIYLFFYIFPLCKFCVDFHTFYGAIYTKCLLFFTVICLYIYLFIFYNGSAFFECYFSSDHSCLEMFIVWYLWYTHVYYIFWILFFLLYMYTHVI